MEHIASDLRAHLGLCQQMLQLAERENKALRKAEAGATQEFHELRKVLLPNLEQSLGKLKQHRLSWQRLSQEERAQYPEVSGLIRAAQELINKTLVLDRENEQILLRRGLLPANKLPSPQQQRPNFVADLYRRNHGK